MQGGTITIFWDETDKISGETESLSVFFTGPRQELSFKEENYGILA